MKPLRLVYRRRHPQGTKLLRASFHVLTHDSEEGFVPNAAMPSIILDRGALTVGRTPVHTATFTEDHITWIQQTQDRYTSGHLFIHDGGRSVHGVVYHGSTPMDAVRHDIVGTAVKPVTYKTTITRNTHPATTDPSKLPTEEWEEGLPLTISYELSLGESLPSPKVMLDGEDVTLNTSWSIDSQDRTVLTVELDDEICFIKNQLYKQAVIAFDMYVPLPEGMGKISALCSEPESKEAAEVRFWKAVPVQHQVLFAELPFESIAAHDVLAAPTELTINELMTILPDQSVNDDSNSMLMRNMKWAMGQDDTQREWLSSFFGQKPPVIDEEDQVALVKQSLDWYQSKFAKAYLTQSFQEYAGPNAPSHRLDDALAKKLDSFLKEGLAASKDFNVQHQGIFVDAYIGAKPRLRVYIQNGGEKWAKELYEVLTNSPQFVLMVNRVSGASGDPAKLAPLNNFACLLTALQPSGELARNYYKSVMTGVIVKLVPQTSQNDKDTIMEWLPTAMQEMFRRLANGELPEEIDISKQEAEELYQEYLKHQNEITSSVAELMQAIIASNLIKKVEQMEEGFKEIVQKYPKLAKAAKLFLVIGWIGGLASIITALVKGDWKKMTGVEKGEFVTECVQSVIQGFDAVPILYNGVKSVSVSAFNKLMSKFYSPEHQSEVEGLGEKLTEENQDLIPAVSEELQPLLNTAEGALGEGTLYARLFGESILAGVLKIVGAVAAAAMAGWSLWQLVNDIKARGSVSTIVFDSLIFTANFLSAVCLVADLFVATSFLPILGAALAIAGIFIAFLANFFETPKNPIDDFMVDVGIPFVQGLPSLKSNAAPVRVNLVVSPVLA
ncbi:hypothetical protein ACFFK0_28120 [Paenibacillus chartarius]|uniref:Uncharacterized protein n=1 Tax=Paenibacillus chartarius TaxID=747481 RepID=A0ABV6DUC8_9BACL